MEGLNNFDKIYYINLAHRQDRNLQIQQELSKTNIDSNKITRINGIYDNKLGCLGCAKSHCLALSKFLESPKTNQTCIIFEDDFEFTLEQDKINELINNFFKNVKKFDVLMLSSNTLNEEPTTYNFITKILDAQTLSGYAIHRSFAPLLLNNFRNSVAMLEKSKQKIHHQCIDINIKILQPYTNWYCLNPKVGKQRESYSDIEEKLVNYEC